MQCPKPPPAAVCKTPKTKQEVGSSGRTKRRFGSRPQATCVRPPPPRYERRGKGERRRGACDLLPGASLLFRLSSLLLSVGLCCARRRGAFLVRSSWFCPPPPPWMPQDPPPPPGGGPFTASGPARAVLTASRPCMKHRVTDGLDEVEPPFVGLFMVGATACGRRRRAWGGAGGFGCLLRLVGLALCKEEGGGRRCRWLSGSSCCGAVCARGGGKGVEAPNDYSKARLCRKSWPA